MGRVLLGQKEAGNRYRVRGNLVVGKWLRVAGSKNGVECLVHLVVAVFMKHFELHF